MTPRTVSLVLLLGVVALLGSVFYRVITPFLMPMFLAAMMAVICQPLQQRLLKSLGGRRTLAAAATTSAVIASVLIPVLITVLLGASELIRVTSTMNVAEVQAWARHAWTDYVAPVQARLQAAGILVAEPQVGSGDVARELKTFGETIARTTLTVAADSVSTAISLSIAVSMFLISLFYFLCDGEQMLLSLRELIPVPVEHQQRLAEQFATSVRSVVMATFLAALAQGLATAVALQIAGAGHFFLFLIGATIAALIPLAGTTLAWGPVAIWLAVNGHWTGAVLLTIYGAVFVSTLDNVVRTYVLQSDAALHPLLAFVSVLGALQVLGLWGVFIGPIVASCLYAAVQIFNRELHRFETTRPDGGAFPPHVALDVLGAPEGTPQTTIVGQPSAPTVTPTTPVTQAPG